MATMKYDILLLGCNTRSLLLQFKMKVVLAQIDLDDALLGFEKMPSSWSPEEKQCKD